MMAQAGSGKARAVRWILLLGLAFGLRVAAAFAVQWYADRNKTPCVFGDTAIYRDLAAALVEGRPYRVDQWDVPHVALRTPGYPAFLALCRLLFGPGLLPARIVQALLGTLSVGLVGLLATCFASEDRRGSTAWWAACLAALDPYLIVLSALALSEALFLPLMMGSLWAITATWPARREDWGKTEAADKPVRLAALAGLLMGLAVLTRPSWLAYVAALLVIRVVCGGRGELRRSLRISGVMALVFGLVMLPWWVRNGSELGRFVPTALWVGASLYDGISPTADGSSEMSFLDAPDVRALSEVEQDRELRSRSLAFARSHPGRVLELAWIKAGRFWSPWPNAASLTSPLVAVVSMAATLPVFALVGWGAWLRRGDPRTWAVLLGTLVVFFGLHLVFVSSVRYRAPGMAPAAVLAGVSLARMKWVTGDG